MKILYLISLGCLVALAFAAFAVARHVRKAGSVAVLPEKKPVVSARLQARKLRKAS